MNGRKTRVLRALNQAQMRHSAFALPDAFPASISSIASSSSSSFPTAKPILPVVLPHLAHRLSGLSDDDAPAACPHALVDTAGLRRRSWCSSTVLGISSGPGAPALFPRGLAARIAGVPCAGAPLVVAASRAFSSGPEPGPTSAASIRKPFKQPVQERVVEVSAEDCDEALDYLKNLREAYDRKKFDESSPWEKV